MVSGLELGNSRDKKNIWSMSSPLDRMSFDR